MTSEVGTSEQSSGLPGTCPKQLLPKQTWALGHDAEGGQLSGWGRREEELDLLVPSPFLNHVNAFLSETRCARDALLRACVALGLQLGQANGPGKGSLAPL